MNKLFAIALMATTFFTACETADTSENAQSTEHGTTTEAIAETKGIKFHEGTWADALAKAKAENKLIFLDISASWCGPCKQLKKTTFSDATVGEFYNNQFINVEVDGEIGEGIALAQQYKIEGYPSLFLLNSDGAIVQQTVGFLEVEQFIQFGKSVVEQ